MADMMEENELREVFRCNCSEIDHVFEVNYLDYVDELFPDKEVYINVMLDDRVGFFKRIWYAFKYVFSIGNKNKCCVAEIILDQPKTEKLHQALSEIVETFSGSSTV